MFTNSIGIHITKKTFQGGGIFSDAEGLYSLRKLGNQPNAIRVRRASDNATQDIGFSGGALDESSLQTFCTGTDGFVTTWYDQSGNGNHFTQTTNSRQPQIVSSGNVIKESNEPALYFNGTSTGLMSSLGSEFNVSVNPDSLISTFTVFTREVTNAYHGIWEIDSTTQTNQYWNNAILNFGANGFESIRRLDATVDGVASTLGVSAGVSYIQTYIAETTNIDVWLNQTSYINDTAAAYSWGAFDEFNLGWKNRAGSVGDYFKGHIKELIVYTADKTSNRLDIEDNIINHYSSL